jgi:hypothetical protein
VFYVVYCTPDILQDVLFPAEVGPCHMAWHILRFWMGVRPSIWRVVANILNKQLPTGGDTPAWGLGEVLTTPHLKNWPCLETD